MVQKPSAIEIATNVIEIAVEACGRPLVHSFDFETVLFVG